MPTHKFADNRGDNMSTSAAGLFYRAWGEKKRKERERERKRYV